jgi:hypothetical protein
MRQRIFLGFASILILFLGIGLYAFWLLSRIGGALDVIVSDSQSGKLFGAAIVLQDVTRFRLMDEVKSNLEGAKA